MKKLITALNTLFLTGCNVFGIPSAEEAGYVVLEDHAHIQIRRYHPLVVAQTGIAADYKDASNQAFKRLFDYITGNNQKRQPIAMTTPVIQQPQAETIAMTAPVIQQQSGQTWLMSFVLPKVYSLSAAPTPLDSTVVLKQLPEQKVAVLRYSGRLTEQNIAAKAEELQIWLEQQGYPAVSPVRSAAYDPPWTLPFLRRNEVHITLE